MPGSTCDRKHDVRLLRDIHLIQSWLQGHSGTALTQCHPERCPALSHIMPNSHHLESADNYMCDLGFCVCVCVCESCSVVSDSLQSHGLQPTVLLCSWNSPGKNTEVSSHFSLQGIFPTQGSKLSLLHCRQILYHLSHQGSPREFTCQF